MWSTIAAYYVVVALHADAVHGHAVGLHGADHLTDAVALHGVALVVVVVEEQRVGIRLTGEDEGLADELVAAAYLIEGGFAQRLVLAVGTDAAAAVGNAFVEHIPGIDHVLIAVDHGVDVLPHALVEHLFADQLVVLVVEHPVAHLVVPHQAVSAQLDAVLTAEVGHTVGALPGPFAFSRMHGGRLHVVLGRDAAELLFHQSALGLVRDVATVDGHADEEIVAVGLLEALRITLRTGPGKHRQGTQCR